AKHFLHAERCIIDHLLEIALEENFNVSARLLLLSTLEKEARRRPDIGQEYRQRIEQLQREYPLAQPAQGLAQAALARVYSRMAA
ncbi:MAG TPA: hypothetical protein VNT26_11840, partial [Candidatus Sulfotelmatobacter sp.]|nr:hypothetical protein [Candidatus Sulfotelmatobacter sp.]